MATKEFNCQIARKVVTSPFWRAEFFPELFSDTFTMELPAAPPGMPQNFDVWETERCFEWLNRTVKTWSAELQEFYSTPDPNQFWAVGYCGGNVYWGNQDGSFYSKFFLRLEMSGGKVNYIKAMMDPMSFLRAAGRDVPTLHKALDHPLVDEYLASHPAALKSAELKSAMKEEEQGLDLSPEAIEYRIKCNLLENACGVERETYRKLQTVSPHYSGGAWFVPDDRPWATIPDRVLLTDNHEVPISLRPRVTGWIKASSPWMYRDKRSIIYPTDNPGVYFIEMRSHGPARWLGNGCDHGHYHQPYWIVIRLDEAGRLTHRAEILNPVYKYNSINITLPTFPYYL